MTSSERDVLVRQLAMMGAKEFAPETVARFDATAKAYFDDREGALRADDEDAILGWGDAVTVGLGIGILYVADKVVDYYLSDVLSRTGGAVGRLFRRRSEVPPSVADLPPLDPEQRAALRAYVQEGAKRYGIESMAGEVFEQLVKSLGTTSELEDPLSS